MRKFIFTVPKGIQFISEWKDYVFPKGEHCIVDKGVTGCGYTEFCLTNDSNVVLCSPRKLLLENKYSQHEKDINICYLTNEVGDYDGVKSMRFRIARHIDICRNMGLPVKFMVTYDSLHYISEYLKEVGLIEEFVFLVDEFQAIFLDSYFKSDVELSFVESLQVCPSTIYLSATPMLDKYLDKLQEFKNLPFYYLDWSKSGFVENVKINRFQVASLVTECASIINSYKSGKFPITTNSEGKVVESREAVFYFNSVADILKIVNKCKLGPENTRIICSRTEDNIKKLKKKGFEVGSVPLKGEENPMFMFCTSAIYMGVDFYSDNASSYVFADPNIESLALDISLDLPQIIGRQRDKSNPFKNDICLFYRAKRKDEVKLTCEAFEEIQERRRFATEELLELYDLAQSDSQKLEYVYKLRSDVLVSQYSRDFVAISKNTGKPVYNSLIEIANERAWEVSQEEYQNLLMVTRSIEKNGFVVANDRNWETPEQRDYADRFLSLSWFNEKMKLYCEFADKYPEQLDWFDSRIREVKFRKYYDFYGTSGCSAKKFVEKKLIAGWKDSYLEDDLKDLIYSRFEDGGRYTLKEIKSTLSDFYNRLGISKTPKATDLGEYFKLSRTIVTLPDKSTDNGYKLTKLE